MKPIGWLIVVAFIAVLVAALLTGTFQGQPTSAAAADAPGVAQHDPRILIVSIDGLRPDVLLRSKSPHLHALLESGSFSMWAVTTDVAITLPSHVSMLTGVPPERHGINYNGLPAPGDIAEPRVPTLFQKAKQAGFSTAVVSGKAKFTIFCGTDRVDWSWVSPVDMGDDARVASEAVRIIHDHRPQVMFLHLASVDIVGHGKGWGTPEQLAAIEAADTAVGTVLDALREANVFDHTTIIITADHGGAGRMHGGTDPRSRHIPWIASGPDIRPGYDLTLNPELTIHTEDTFATACHVLGIDPGDVQGRPVLDIYAHRELLTPTTQAATTQPATAPAQK